jgi:hypothetical protein
MDILPLGHSYFGQLGHYHVGITRILAKYARWAKAGGTSPGGVGMRVAETYLYCALLQNSINWLSRQGEK